MTDDPDSGSRFTAMRQFAIEACTQSGSTDCSGIGSDGYRRILTRPESALKSVQPGRSRRPSC